MKRIRLFSILIILFLSLQSSFSQSLKDGVTSNSFEIKNIAASVANNGSITDAYWNHPERSSENKQIIFDMGLQITGKINGEVVSAFNQWVSTFSPGPILDGKAAMVSHPEDQAKYRVYRIQKGDDSSNPDYAEWPVDFGAPVDKNGKPILLGDENLWCVYNSFHDSVSTQFKFLKNMKKIPLEIHQYTYGRKNANDVSIFNDLMFIEYSIINKGDYPIDSMNIGLWADVDFYDGESFLKNNIPAVDVNRNLGYCWSRVDSTNSMIAVGVAQLFGPVVNQSNSQGVFKGKSVANKKNLELSAFHAIADDAVVQSYLGSIRSNSDAWYYSMGLDFDGQKIFNPITFSVTRFPFDGDPVAGSGWIYNPDSIGLGGGAGFSIYSGSVNLAPNDTQWVMYALVPAIGKSGKDAIVDLRMRVDSLRSLSYNDLLVTSFKDDNSNTSIPSDFVLNQNYPNPFNPSTLLRFSLPFNQHVELKIFDVLGNEIAKLLDEQKSAGNYEIKFNASEFGLSSGIYFYQLRTKDFIQTRKMILMK